MDGIVFFATRQHDTVVQFYRDTGTTVWREQPDCTILEHGHFRLGFCARDEADTDGIVTFVYPDREGVDTVYQQVTDTYPESTETPPQYSEKYNIYQAFVTDPEGRTVEFQTFESTPGA